MIDVLVPTIGRAVRLATVAANIHAATEAEHRVVFIVEEHDARSRCVVGACHPPTEPVRCVFAADYETTPWRCERLAGHEGAHRSGPVAPSER